jgi:hypothetical protein
MWNPKILNSWKPRVEWWIPRTGDGKKEKCRSKIHFNYTGRLKNRDLWYIMVTIVSNNVLCT